MSPTLPSTYGAWLISLFLETILYGIGIVQTWLYVQWWWQTDGWSVKAPIIIVMFFETAQITFFFRSTYFRFVQRFGLVQEDLIWSDSLQLLANYFTAFAVQIFFTSRICRLTRESVRMYRTSAVGICIVVILALAQISAGIAQTILSYRLRLFSKLDETKAITTLQTAGSLACDIVITVYLCVFLQRKKSGLPRRVVCIIANVTTKSSQQYGEDVEHTHDQRRQSRYAHCDLFGPDHDPVSCCPQHILVLPWSRSEQQAVHEQHACDVEHAPARPRQGPDKHLAFDSDGGHPNWAAGGADDLLAGRVSSNRLRYNNSVLVPRIAQNGIISILIATQLNDDSLVQARPTTVTRLTPHDEQL